MLMCSFYHKKSLNPNIANLSCDSSSDLQSNKDKNHPGAEILIQQIEGGSPGLFILNCPCCDEVQHTSAPRRR